MVRWLIASRAPVLVMTFCSAALGGLLALLHGPIDALAWFGCLGGLLLAHAANNQLNDFTDSALGIDKGDYFRNRYGAHVLEDELLTHQQLLVSIAITAFAALLIGLWLTLRIGSDVLWPLTGGALLLLFYTYPLKKLGLGEIAVLLVWGPLMTGGSYLVASGVWSPWVAAIGAIYALAPTTVIFGKHIDKRAFDEAKHVRTLPVRLGSARARHVAVVMLVLPYVAILMLVALERLPWPSLLALFALPDAIRATGVFRRAPPDACPPDYPAAAWPLWYSAFAFVHARNFGLYLLAGLAAAWLVGAPFSAR